jgi:hypothetical protein
VKVGALTEAIADVANELGQEFEAKPLVFPRQVLFHPIVKQFWRHQISRMEWR